MSEKPRGVQWLFRAGIAAQMKRQGALSSEELKEQGDRQEVVVGGIVTALVPRTTKKGQPMASVTLEDLTGTIPVTVFPKAYEEFARFLEKDRIILVKGKTSIREPLGAANGGSLPAGHRQPLVQVSEIEGRIGARPPRCHPNFPQATKAGRPDANTRPRSMP